MPERWTPPVETTPAEDKLLKLLKKQKLWVFLRRHRHELIDDEVREKLGQMYASSGRGKPVSPERLALALVLQVFTGLSDHEVPIATATDRRWRMVLDLLDQEVDEAAFSQGTVFHFRERARAHGLIEFLLERTVHLARETKGFSHKRLRMMIDSSPISGAGRVEDTFNLIGRAIGRLAAVAAEQSGRTPAELSAELELSVVSASSVKSALDVDWRLPEARNDALNALIDQFSRLQSWLEDQFDEATLATPPLSDCIAVVTRLLEQDTEPDPDSPISNAKRVRKGGADRQVSLSDPDMRHGRKSKSKLFVGYKRHISVDADVPGLVTGVKVLPANVREYAAAKPLLESAEGAGFEVTEVHHDRGYLPSEALHERRAKGMRMVSKPPSPPRTRKRLGKADFTIDVEAGTVTCPAGHTRTVHHGKWKAAASFTRSICRRCPLMSKCLPKNGQKVIVLHPHEDLFQQWAAELATADGRAQRRERVVVEHALGRLSSIQGNKARFRGLEKVQFHTACCALIANLHVLDGLHAAAA